MQNIHDALNAAGIEIPSVRDRMCVTLIGCGGTGSKLVPELCQALALFNARRYSAPLLLVDNDIVEEKNLVRQHFIANDVGRPKAQVLAERYAAAFGVDVRYNVTLVDTEDDLYPLLLQIEDARAYSGWSECIYLLFTAVDNHATRAVIHRAIADAMAYSHNIVWVDLANEEVAGQMVIGTSLYGRTMQLPFVTEVFPEILQEATVRPSQLPCGAGGVQDLNINAAAATHAASFFRWLLKNFADNKPAPLNYHMVEFGVNPPSARVHYNTWENLSKYSWIGTRLDKIKRVFGVSDYWTGYASTIPTGYSSSSTVLDTR